MFNSRKMEKNSNVVMCCVTSICMIALQIATQQTNKIKEVKENGKLTKNSPFIMFFWMFLEVCI